MLAGAIPSEKGSGGVFPEASTRRFGASLRPVIWNVIKLSLKFLTVQFIGALRSTQPRFAN
jgi:hypothetical protein